MTTAKSTKTNIRTRAPVKASRKPAKWNNAAGDSEEQYQLKKQAVIAEAARAFGRHGYQNVSLDEIAHALNVTKPALYYYFRNKQVVIYVCLALSMRIGDQVLQESIASRSDGYGRIVAFVENYVAHLTNDMGAPAVLQDFSSMAPADQKKILLRRRKFDLQLRKIVEDGIRDGSIAPCDPKLAVFWFMGAVKSISQWYHADGTLTGEQVAREFIAFMSHGIRRGSSAQT